METAARRHIDERMASLLRWLDVAAGVAVAIVLATVARPLLSRYSAWLADTLHGHSLLIQFAVLSLYSGFIWLMVIRLGGFRPVDLLNESWLRYPPAWLGGVLGAFAYMVLPHLWNRGEGAAGTGADGWIVLAAVIIMGPAGIAIALLCDGLVRGASSKDDQSDGVEDDAPITTPKQDEFKYDAIAQCAKRSSALLAG